MEPSSTTIGGYTEEFSPEFKLGRHGGDGIARHEFDNLWQLHHEPAPRLQVATAGSYVDLLLKMAAQMPQPYQLLYILVAPQRPDRRPGRYEAARAMKLSELSDLLNRFKPFFERDARHHLSISSVDDRSQVLVLDQHDYLYAYGDLNRFRELLRELGHREGTIQLPFPHSHHYHRTMDFYEDELISQHEWTWSELQPEDES